MKILNICRGDWSNFSHDNAKALRSVGLSVEDVKEYKHEFGYESQSIILPKFKLLEKIKQADVIQIMHSDEDMLRLCKKAKGKRIIVYHTGTHYRKNHNRLNKEFNPFVETSIIALGEFAGLGSKNEKYMVGAVDCSKILPNYSTGESFVFAHYPSSAKVKGTDIIVKHIREAYEIRKDFSFYMNSDSVPYKEQLKRMNKCDIYIELFAPKQDGYNYGSWGITALEAAAMGKVVMTCHTTEEVYEKTYGEKTPFIISNTEEALKRNIEYVLSLSAFKLQQLKVATRNWVYQHHSYESTAKKWKELTGIN